MTNREEGEILKGRNRYIHFVARRRRRRLVKGTNDGRYAWPIRHSLLSLDWRRRRLMRDEAPSKLRFIGAIRWSSSVTSCVARSDENLTRMKSFERERERVGDGNPSIQDPYQRCPPFGETDFSWNRVKRANLLDVTNPSSSGRRRLGGIDIPCCSCRTTATSSARGYASTPPTTRKLDVTRAD